MIVTLSRLRIQAQIAQNLKFFDIAGALDFDILHPLGVGPKRRLSERLLSRDHKDHIIRHQAQNGRRVSCSRCIEPFLHQTSNRLFILLHKSPLPNLPFRLEPIYKKVPGESETP